MKVIPILFSTPMVQAILAGRKTMTRRIVKPVTQEDYALLINMHAGVDVERCKEELLRCSCPYGEPGDILWVKETFEITGFNDDKGTVCGYYLADGISFNDISLTEKEWNKFSKWKKKLGVKSSLFMFRSLSRIYLENKVLKVELLQDISEDDAWSEGIEVDIISPTNRVYKNYLTTEKDGILNMSPSARYSFKTLWQKINGSASWDANPWVWVISFKRIDRPAGFLPY